jgi:hypothetical protein
MLKKMGSYYQSLKDDVNIEVKEDDDEGQIEEDPELDDILRTLKPNTTSTNFKEFLKREDNCIKT